MKRRLNFACGIATSSRRCSSWTSRRWGVDPQSRARGFSRAGDRTGERPGSASCTRRTTWRKPRSLCDCLAIIDEGKIIAEYSLQRRCARTVHLQVGAWPQRPTPCRPSRGSIRRQPTPAASRSSRTMPPRSAEILAATTEAGVTVQSVEVIEPDLEAVFLHLTGKRCATYAVAVTIAAKDLKERIRTVPPSSWRSPSPSGWPSSSMPR